MTEQTPEYGSVLLDAFGLVHGSRNDVYGDPWDDYSRTVELFNVATGADLSTVEGLLFMVCVKLSRLAYGLEVGLEVETVRDSITDACGYLECIWATLNQPTDDDDDGGDECDLDPVPAPEGAAA